MDQKIMELTLLLMYLTGWEEDSRKNPGEKIFCSWKGHSFMALNKLADDNLIIQFKDKKLTILTEAGRNAAENLKAKYFGNKA